MFCLTPFALIPDMFSPKMTVPVVIGKSAVLFSNVDSTLGNNLSDDANS